MWINFKQSILGYLNKYCLMHKRCKFQNSILASNVLRVPSYMQSDWPALPREIFQLFSQFRIYIYANKVICLYCYTALQDNIKRPKGAFTFLIAPRQLSGLIGTFSKFQNCSQCQVPGSGSVRWCFGTPICPIPSCCYFLACIFLAISRLAFI